MSCFGDWLLRRWEHGNCSDTVDVGMPSGWMTGLKVSGSVMLRFLCVGTGSVQMAASILSGGGVASALSTASSGPAAAAATAAGSAANSNMNYGTGGDKWPDRPRSISGDCHLRPELGIWDFCSWCWLVVYVGRDGFAGAKNVNCPSSLLENKYAAISNAPPVASPAANTGGEEEKAKENQCKSLLMCIVTTLNEGLRNGGGIGDVLRKPSSPRAPISIARLVRPVFLLPRYHYRVEPYFWCDHRHFCRFETGKAGQGGGTAQLVLYLWWALGWRHCVPFWMIAMSCASLLEPISRSHWEMKPEEHSDCLMRNVCNLRDAERALVSSVLALLSLHESYLRAKLITFLSIAKEAGCCVRAVMAAPFWNRFPVIVWLVHTRSKDEYANRSDSVNISFDGL